MSSWFDIMNEDPVLLGTEEQFPLFKRISIETSSFCNRSCHFCPIAWSGDERGITYMTDFVFNRVAEELHQLEFAGVSQLFLLNEPTIDKTLKAKLAQIRAACPKTTQYISTNGDTFNAIWKSRGLDAALQEIKSYFDAGLTSMNINVYDLGPAQMERYTELYSAILAAGVAEPTEHRYRKHPVKRRFVALTDMRIEERPQDEVKKTDLLYIRNKHERVKVIAPQIYCARTQNHLVILYDGSTPVCCAVDPTDKSLPPVGNVNNSSLVEIWNTETMFKYRFFTQHARRVLPGCSTCTHRMAYAHVVRKVDASEAKKAEWEAEAAAEMKRHHDSLEVSK